MSDANASSPHFGFRFIVRPIFTTSALVESKADAAFQDRVVQFGHNIRGAVWTKALDTKLVGFIEHSAKSQHCPTLDLRVDEQLSQALDIPSVHLPNELVLMPKDVVKARIALIIHFNRVLADLHALVDFSDHNDDSLAALLCTGSPYLRVIRMI